MKKKIKAYLVIILTMILIIDDLYIMFNYWTLTKLSILMNHPIISLVIPTICTLSIYYLIIHKKKKDK